MDRPAVYQEIGTFQEQNMKVDNEIKPGPVVASLGGARQSLGKNRENNPMQR